MTVRVFQLRPYSPDYAELTRLQKASARTISFSRIYGDAQIGSIRSRSDFHLCRSPRRGGNCKYPLSIGLEEGRNSRVAFRWGYLRPGPRYRRFYRERSRALGVREKQRN